MLGIHLRPVPVVIRFRQVSGLDVRLIYTYNIVVKCTSAKGGEKCRRSSRSGWIEKLIESAKKYAKRSGKSVSQLVSRLLFRA